MRRLLFLVLPTTAAFGSLIPGVSGLFAFRILILIIFASTVFGRRTAVRRIQSVFVFRLLAALWTVVGLLGTFFVQDVDSALRALLPVFLGFLLILSLISLKDKNAALLHLRQGWVLAFVSTGFLALREMITGVHMPNYLTSVELAAVDTRMVASVFGNPNAYGTFLAASFVFLVGGLVDNKGRIARASYMLMIFTLIGLMLATGSRLSLLALLLELVVFAFFAGTRFRRTAAAGLLVVFTGVFIAGTGATDSMVARLPGKLTMAAPSIVVQEIVGGDSSSSAARRLNLYRDGIWMVLDSGGLGEGPGTFANVMRSGVTPYDTGGVVDPHNGYLEIAAQYGLAVFLTFIAWVGYCFRSCWKGIRIQMGNRRTWAMSMIAGLVGGAVSALASSSYLPNAVNWMFLANMMLVVVVLETENAGNFGVAGNAADDPDTHSHYEHRSVAV